MDNKVEKASEERSEWVKPELRVMDAGDAETGATGTTDNAVLS